MKAREDTIKPVGLTLLYEPEGSIDPAVDIVLVHGIGGHPVQSWKWENYNQTAAAPRPTVPIPDRPNRSPANLAPELTLRWTNPESLLDRQGHLAKSRRLNNWAQSSSWLNLTGLPESSPLAKSQPLLRYPAVNSSIASLALKPVTVLEHGGSRSQLCLPSVETYWPLDLLPASCPNSRIITWGYRPLTSDHRSDIVAHASELLVELASTRQALDTGARPIIFVAHSTGGVLVKELLRLSEAEHDGPLKEILLSTSAVIFLGSPHRGTDNWSLGDAVKSMAGATLNLESDDPLLEELCDVNTAEIELGRQTFLRLWNDHNFSVKTFHQSIIQSHSRSGSRAETAMQHLAGFFGDPREDAETIRASHEDICKFNSVGDIGYSALARTLSAFIAKEEEGRHVMDDKETECLAALARPHLTPTTHHPTPFPGTCLWLYDLPDFQTWYHRNGPEKDKVLWVNAPPGCGKTVLLRSLQDKVEREWGSAGASFIWASTESCDASIASLPGDPVSNPTVVYRSLLAQLFPQDANLRKALWALIQEPRADSRAFDDTQITSFFSEYCANQKIETSSKRTFIFVEIADDACATYVQELVTHLARLARNSDFTICVTSGCHREAIENENVISIPLHQQNYDDILLYVNLHLVTDWEEGNRTAVKIAEKASGVFLWAEIVVNILNEAIIEGATQEMIEFVLEEAPGDLHGLYERMLSTLEGQEQAEALTIFQWVMLAAEPMCLDDLALAVRLTDPNAFTLYKKHGALMAFNLPHPPQSTPSAPSPSSTPTPPNSTTGSAPAPSVSSTSTPSPPPPSSPTPTTKSTPSTPPSGVSSSPPPSASQPS